MAKTKISATITPSRLAEARAVTGLTNVSAIIDLALAALVDLEKERRWLAAHPDPDLPLDVIPDLSELPWEEPPS